MELRPGEDLAKKTQNRNEEPKPEAERPFLSCVNDLEESDFKNVANQPKDGAAAPKLSDVRNGDLVSLLLAATPPYLYNIPLVPQTFFFSEMLKSFVQAKTERQNLKAHQAHHRRPRKRSWREATPPKTMAFDPRDKPLELTTPKQLDEKPKIVEKGSIKKFQVDGSEKKCETSEFGGSNFSVEKLANSSITTSSESINGSVNSGDMLPPAPPLWYPLLYPPHPPYGIDPLHFFIDLRVSAHFWDKKLTSDKIPMPPVNLRETEGLMEASSPPCSPRYISAFSVPTTRNSTHFPKGRIKKNSQNVHYVVSSLKSIYKTLDEKENKELKKIREKEEKKCNDLRAVIGLELVVDYFKQESNKEDTKSKSRNHSDSELHILSIE